MSETYVECLVKHKSSVALNILKWVLITVTSFFGFMGIMGAVVPFVIAIITGILAYIVSLSADLEYEYLYLDRELTVDKIMNQTRRKRIESLQVDRIEIIAPIKSHHLDSYRNRKLKTTDYSVGEELQPDNRFVMYYNGNRKIILSPSPELLKAIRTVAPRKVFVD